VLSIQTEKKKTVNRTRHVGKRAPACASDTAARHHVASRVPRAAHALHTRHAHRVPPIARFCDRLQHTQFILHAYQHFLHNFPNMSLHSHHMPTTIPHMLASSVAHSCPPTAPARIPSIESQKHHS
jgi:hypothetical protein